MRIIAFGISGTGISSTCNTILGQHIFETGTGFMPITNNCELQKANRLERRVSVVDTPGFPVGMEENRFDEILHNLRRAVKMLEPGPNIFLLVVSVERYTEDHRFMVRCLQQLREISKFTIIAFNRIDCSKESKFTMMKKINESETLHDLLQISSRRFVLLDNTSPDEIQVTALFDMASNIVRENGFNTFTEDAFRGESVNQVNDVYLNREQKWQHTIDAYCPRPGLLQRIQQSCNIL